MRATHLYLTNILPFRVSKHLQPYYYCRKYFEILDRIEKFSYEEFKEPSRYISELQKRYFPRIRYKQIESIFKAGLHQYELSVSQSFKIFDPDWKAGPTLGSLIYTLIELLQPKIVVETGIANGVSTRLILKTLPAESKLYSFDVNPLTATSVQGFKNWEWKLIELSSPKRSMQKLFAELGIEVDLWIHDSDHSRYWQRFEYQLAISKLAKGGFLVSDDIQTSSAWLREFSGENTLEFREEHKPIGIWQKK